MTTMTTQVPAAAGNPGPPGGTACGAMKTELQHETSGEDEGEVEEDAEEMDDMDSRSGGADNEELFDYIYGSESNDNYVMGE